MEPRGAEYLSIKAMAASQRRRSPRSHLLGQFPAGILACHRRHT